MPSPLTVADVRRIAALARLELSDAEVDMFAAQLSAILAYAGQLQDVETSGVRASAAARLPVTIDALRRDVPEPSLPRDAVLNGAPGAATAAGFFTVPRVLGS
jgi:aspartyl-tRNA(Asn)/glutamyl-tRNA(Gln) amidotransferase subunit C